MFLLRRPPGFALRLTGANEVAERHAGVCATAVTVGALLISGGLAGLGRGVSAPRRRIDEHDGQLLGGLRLHRDRCRTPRAGVTVGSSPAALLFAALRQAAAWSRHERGSRRHLVLITQGLVIVFVAGSQFLLDRQRGVPCRCDSAGEWCGRSPRGSDMGPFDTVVGVDGPAVGTLLLAATGELISERGGVLNIGLEGMMLSGALLLVPRCVPVAQRSTRGVDGMGAGLVVPLLMALLCVRLRSTRSSSASVSTSWHLVSPRSRSEIFATQAEVRLDYPRPIAIPGLSELPSSAARCSSRRCSVTSRTGRRRRRLFVLYRTSFGLSLRAAGESPAAADTAGASVNRIRTVGTCVAGALAGAAGAYLSVGRLGIFNEGMTGGRGYPRLAAVIFGGWRPSV